MYNLGQGLRAGCAGIRASDILVNTCPIRSFSLSPVQEWHSASCFLLVLLLSGTHTRGRSFSREHPNESAKIDRFHVISLHGKNSIFRFRIHHVSDTKLYSCLSLASTTTTVPQNGFQNSLVTDFSPFALFVPWTTPFGAFGV